MNAAERIDYDLDTLARTLYGEAKANDEEDARAIGHVVLNRLSYSRWPNSVAKVCRQRWQFSCWNPNDPNRERICKASSPWFERCRTIAAELLSPRAVEADPTFRSTHYHTPAVAPYWARGKTPVYETHGHLFYNDIDTPPPFPDRPRHG